MDEIREKGDWGEKQLLPIIQRRYPDAFIIPFSGGTNHKGDIQLPNGELIEVKTDYENLNTVNIAIERWCRFNEIDEGHPSGISNSESKWWVIINPNYKYWLIELEELRRLVLDNSIRRYKGWFDNVYKEIGITIRHNTHFYNQYSGQYLDMFFIPELIFQEHCLAYGHLSDFPLNLIQ